MLLDTHSVLRNSDRSYGGYAWFEDSRNCLFLGSLR